MQQPANRIIYITIVVIALALYSWRNRSAVVVEVENEEISVALCQVHARFDADDTFDDRTLLSLLATLKMHDFQIGQPVWGSSNSLLYLCEHRLKTGLKQSTLNQELKNVIKNSGASSKRLAWSCA